MPGIDATTLPIWLAVVLFLINLFREQLGAFVPQAIRDHFQDQAKRAKNRESHKQEIEETLLDNLIQERVTDSLRDNSREGKLIDLIRQKDEYIQTKLDTRLDEQARLLGKMLEQMSHVRTNSGRTNDLLSAMNGSISRLADLIDHEPPKLNYVQQYIDEPER